MSENLDKEVEVLRKEIAADLGYKRKDKTFRHRRVSLHFKSHRRLLILGGMGLLLIIVLIALFSGDRNKLLTEKPTSTKKQERLNQLEERITRLEGIEKKITLLEKQGKELQQSLEEIDRTGRSLRQGPDKPSQVDDNLQERMTSHTAKAEAPRTMQRIPIAPTGMRYDTQAPLTIKRMPFSLPKRRYHEVRPGESLYWIAQQYGISLDELCRLNHITPKQLIHPGQKLLVAPGSPE
ncbi:MAG: LysM peptidoglycan-binding domain-containing protein [Deltaproteobacteria bacterium]|nr:MAG: LysM peptidoglycan-binding domain-containing protein [Deltaproteobacteria bacterium]